VVALQALDEAIPSPGDFASLHLFENIECGYCDSIAKSINDHEFSFRLIEVLEKDIAPVKITNQDEAIAQVETEPEEVLDDFFGSFGLVLKVEIKCF